MQNLNKIQKASVRQHLLHKTEHMHMARHTLCNTEPQSKQPRDDNGKGTKAAGHSCEPQAAAAWISAETAAMGPNSPDLGCSGNGERGCRAATESMRYRQKQSAPSLFFMSHTIGIQFLLLVTLIKQMLQRHH